MDEKRKERRVSDTLLVSYDLPQGGRVKHQATSENISHRGMKIKIAKNCARELSKGQIVNLTFQTLGDSIPVEVKAKIVWVGVNYSQDNNLCTVGFMFLDIDEFKKKRIDGYLKRKS